MNYNKINYGEYESVTLGETVSPKSLKFTNLSRNNIASKALYENIGISNDLFKDESTETKTGMQTTPQMEEDIKTKKIVTPDDFIAVIMADSKKLKLPHDTFDKVLSYKGSHITDNVSVTPLSPHYIIIEPVNEEVVGIVDELTTEESEKDNMLDEKLETDLWKMPENQSILDNTSIVDKVTEKVEEPSVMGNSTLEETNIWKTPIVNKEEPFKPQEVPSIAKGLEESNEAQKIREALQKRIRDAAEQAKAEANERLLKAEAEAKANAQLAEEEKRRREVVEEDLSKTKSDYAYLAEELKKVQDEANKLKTENKAYKEVFSEITAPTTEPTRK